MRFGFRIWVKGSGLKVKGSAFRILGFGFIALEIRVTVSFARV